jgi:hypothetical protein
VGKLAVNRRKLAAALDAEEERYGKMPNTVIGVLDRLRIGVMVYVVHSAHDRVPPHK